MTLPSVLCRSSYYADLGIRQEPGQREVRCDRAPDHLGDHAEMVDGQVANSWPRQAREPRGRSGVGWTYVLTVPGRNGSEGRAPMARSVEQIQSGDKVWCRNAAGGWWEATAHSGPRYDYDVANPDGTTSHYRGQWLTVAVGPWGDQEWVNWPAEDVRTERPSNA